MLEKKAPPTESSDLELEEGVDDECRRKVYKRRKTDIAPTSKPKQKTKPKPKLPNDGSTASDSISPAAVSSGAGYYLAPTVDGNEKPPSLKVTETIRLFNKHYLHFVQVYQHSIRFSKPK